MARVFTVPFLYQGRDYTAVVTIRDVHTGRPLSIYVPDESLHHFFPDGKVRIDDMEGIPIDKKELTMVQDIMASIMAAIEVHENHNSSI